MITYAKDESITINQWEDGVNASPITGFNDMRLVDNSAYPGVVTPTIELTRASYDAPEGVTMRKLVNVCQAMGSTYPWTIGVDEIGQVWTMNPNVDSGKWNILSGNSLTNAHGEGIVFWKECLFVFRKDALDVCKDPFGTPVWINDWADYNYVLFNDDHFVYSCGDGRLYFCNGAVRTNDDQRYFIGRIQEREGTIFDPAVDNMASPNWPLVFNSKALDLPSPPNTIEGFGSDLVIGCEDNVVYPWDRIADTWDKDTSFSTVTLPENGTRALLTYNNTLFIFAGATGTIYASNGSSVDIIARMPAEISNYYRVRSNHPKSYFGTYADVVGDRIIFSFHWQDNVSGKMFGAIFSYNLITQKVCIEGRIPNNNVAQATTPYASSIGALISVDDLTYVAGWSDVTSPTTYCGVVQNFVGLTVNPNYHHDEAFIDTELFRIGTLRQTKDVHQLEMSFCEPLSSSNSDGVKIYYRRTLAEAWTLWETVNTNGEKDFVIDSAINSVIDLQLRIVINGNARLRYLRLINN